MATRKGATSQEGEGRKPFLDLDAIGAEPEVYIKLGGKDYAMTRQSDLSLAMQENLTRFYTRLSEVREWKPDEGDDDTGMLSDEMHDLLARLELRICRIALPDAPLSEFEGPDGSVAQQRRTNLVEAFTKAVDHTPFLIRGVQMAQRKMTPTRLRTVPGNASSSTASETPNSSSTSPSAAEAA